MRRIVAAIGLALSAQTHAASSVSADTVAIRAVEAKQEAAWNAHDAHAYASLFTEDGDLVNVLGWWWKGRWQVEQKLGGAFAFVFARSAMRIEDVSVRRLSSDTIIAHVRWSMTGALSPDGSGTNIPQHGIQTQILKRVGKNWLIAAFQNTNGAPERPFPTAPTP